MTAAIGILARAPVPGSCKTRLIPEIGAGRAARLQRHLIERALATACAAHADRIVLFTHGDHGDGLWESLRRSHAIQVLRQRGINLGERLSNAMSALLVNHSRAILMGTDCLTLTPSDLQDAEAALDVARMVFAPAEDGGYAMVGARTFPKSVFQAIAWGGTTVMADTRQRLRGAGWTFGRGGWIELETHWDIDRPADLRRAVGAGLLDSSWGTAHPLET